MRKVIVVISILLIVGGIGVVFKDKIIAKFHPNAKYKFGDSIDALNGVAVYFNGDVGHCGARNRSTDGYNIGIKYQCVEFVKRYYYFCYKHKMPETAGNAIDFFNPKYEDGELNKERGLIQFKNPSKSKPEVGDLLVMKGRAGNKFGHVAIVSKVEPNQIEIIQQNPGRFGSSRAGFDLENKEDNYFVNSDRILGWLRLKKKNQ